MVGLAGRFCNYEKKSTVNSYNLISYFLAKSKGKELWNKQDLNWFKSVKINLPTVMVDWLFNFVAPSVKVSECQNTSSSNCFNFFSVSGVFMRSSSLIQALPTSRCWQWRNAWFYHVFFGVTSYYRKSLCKMSSALFSLEHFSFIFIHWEMNKPFLPIW